MKVPKIHGRSGVRAEIRTLVPQATDGSESYKVIRPHRGQRRAEAGNTMLAGTENIAEERPAGTAQDSTPPSEKSLAPKLVRAAAGDADNRVDMILKNAGIATVNIFNGQQLRTVLQQLSTLLQDSDDLEREFVRTEAVSRLTGAGLKNAKALVGAVLRASVPRPSDALQGEKIVLGDPEPWEEAVNGVTLLNEIHDIFRKYVVLPTDTAIALTLWVMHTYLADSSFVSPVLGIVSPVKRCGKTTLLMLLHALCRRPVLAANTSISALFRMIEKYRPTLLIDEADTFLAQNGELQGILNAGHSQRTAVVHRSVGEDHEPRTFRTYCPKAIALIGQLPGTLHDRAVVINMRRKIPGDRVERFRQDLIDQEVHTVIRKAIRWANDHRTELKGADPQMPAQLNDRSRDNWRPLLAIADVVGGRWPEIAREVAVSTEHSDEGDNTDGITLLRDVRPELTNYPEDKIFTRDLLSRLTARTDLPWSEYKRGRPLTEVQMARMLKPFGITPKKIRIGERAAQGYEIESFEDAFARYLNE